LSAPQAGICFLQGYLTFAPRLADLIADPKTAVMEGFSEDHADLPHVDPAGLARHGFVAAIHTGGAYPYENAFAPNLSGVILSKR
jgi:hypothetical protein